MSLNRNTAIVLILILLVLASQNSTTTPSSKVDRVSYIYEKDDGAVPPPIQYAMRELNKLAIIATVFEIDSTTGLDAVPTQDAIAVAAARNAGLPCLIIQQGQTVVKIVKAPTTVTHVADAVGVEIKEPA